MKHVALLSLLVASAAQAAEIQFDPSMSTPNQCTDAGCNPYYPGRDAVGFFGAGSYTTDPTSTACAWQNLDCNGQGQSVVILDANITHAETDGRAIDTGLVQVRRNASGANAAIPITLNTRVRMDGVDHHLTFTTGVDFAWYGYKLTHFDGTANVAQSFAHGGYAYDLTFVGFGDIVTAGGAGAPFDVDYFGQADTPYLPVAMDRVLTSRVLYTLQRGDVVLTVDAGADREAVEGQAVALSGAAGGAPLSVMWTQTGGQAVTLTGADTLTPTFEAPPVSGGSTLTFELTASGSDFTLSDTVSVDVEACVDLDGDGCDVLGLCFGDDAYGDADGDGLCDNLDFVLTRADEVVAGQRVRFVADNAPPGSRVVLFASVAGTGDGPCYAGDAVCSDVLAPQVIGVQRANARGQAVFRPVAPLDVDDMANLWFQAAWVNVSQPNAVVGTASQVLFVGCGDGELRAAEECDDANDSDVDACTNTCLVGVCEIDNGGCDVHATCTALDANTASCACNEDEDWGGDGTTCAPLPPDADGDGVRADRDCDDTDDRAFPGNNVSYGTPRANGSYDFNCDGHETRATLDYGGYCNYMYDSQISANRCFAEPGWIGAPPACGETQTYLSRCTGTSTSGTQGCSVSYVQLQEQCR